MKNSKRAKLEAAGWAVGSVKEFLGLSEAESALIDMKLALPCSMRTMPHRIFMCAMVSTRLLSPLSHWRS